MQHHLLFGSSPTGKQKINGLPLHIINAMHCISSTQSVVSHQAAVDARFA